MKVKYATQVFSAYVAAGMNLYIRFGALVPQAQATVEFVSQISKLFDLLNSSSAATTFTKTDDQKQRLNDTFTTFHQLQVVNWKGENM